MAGNNEASPPAQPPNPTAPPVITELDDGEETKRPRRSGWWSKRLVGG
jgi:hypothetical protein